MKIRCEDPTKNDPALLEEFVVDIESASDFDTNYDEVVIIE